MGSCRRYGSAKKTSKLIWLPLILLLGTCSGVSTGPNVQEVYPSRAQLAKYNRVGVTCSARNVQIEVPASVDEILTPSAAVSGGGSAGFGMAQGAVATTGALLICIPCQLTLIAALPIGMGVASAVKSSRDESQRERVQQMIPISWIESEMSRPFSQRMRESRLFREVVESQGEGETHPSGDLDATISLSIDKISLLSQDLAGARALFVTGSVVMKDKAGIVYWQASETTQGGQAQSLQEWYSDDGARTHRELEGAIDRLAARFASMVIYADAN